MSWTALAYMIGLHRKATPKDALRVSLRAGICPGCNAPAAAVNDEPLAPACGCDLGLVDPQAWKRQDDALVHFRRIQKRVSHAADALREHADPAARMELEAARRAERAAREAYLEARAEALARDTSGPRKPAWVGSAKGLG